MDVRYSQHRPGKRLFVLTCRDQYLYPHSTSRDSSSDLCGAFFAIRDAACGIPRTCNGAYKFAVAVGRWENEVQKKGNGEKEAT